MPSELKIRPAARIIKSIGEDLIKDPYTAVIELVKNAYDADSDRVNIIIEICKDNVYGLNEEFLKFTIEDFGQDMSFDIIEDAWMVPATAYKKDRQFSTIKHRTLQGKKGIGRYASAILGDFLKITTTDLQGYTTIIEIDWAEFERKKYLEDVSIPIQHNKSNLKHGTKIEIYSKIIVKYDDSISKKIESIQWSKKQEEALLRELRNLLSPIYKDKKEDDFKISLTYKGLEKFGISDKSVEIEPFPLIKLYDYRISGSINSKGEAKLIYKNQNFEESNEEIALNMLDILPNISPNELCGNLTIDLRVFDLETESIQELINRGFKDPITNDYAGKAQARTTIKDYSGVGIYRDLFRIRPYGDSEYDWLFLNKKRVNNPTFHISTNQIVGFINIESEEKSHLIEKANREGLKENANYENLKQIINVVLRELETRRYEFRKNTKRGRKPVDDIHNTIKSLFSFDEVSHKIGVLLHKSEINPEIIEKVEKILKDEKEDKDKDLKKIEETLIMYEAHAALGKLVQYVIHEGRKPIQIIGSKLNNLVKIIDYFIKNPTNVEIKDDIIANSNNSKLQLDKLSKIFNILEPLMAKKGERNKEINLYRNIEKNLGFFKEILKKNNIRVQINCDNKDIVFNCKEQDFFIIYSNLIENSIYWFKHSTQNDKMISISLYKQENTICIDYKDNGIGIQDKFLNSIFDPGFSTKPEGGTGIGLTLVGQAVKRNNGDIECIKSACGVYFKLTFMLIEP